MINFANKVATECRTLVFFILGSAVLSACATIDPSPKSSFMSLGAAAAPPVGYLEFCARNPNECVDSAQSADRAGQPASASIGGTSQDTAGHRLASAGIAPISTGHADEPLPPIPSGSAHHHRARRGSRAGLCAVPRHGSDVAPAPDAAFSDDLALSGAFRPAPRPLVQASMSVPGRTHTAAPAPPLRMTPALLNRLEAVNQQINQAIRPLAATRPADDRWRLPIADGSHAGDCKDYVLEKRRALILQGVPERALSIAVVLTARGQGHAVLVVTTDRGEFVLDNLRAWVAPWRSVGYRWLLRQQPGEPLHWVSIVETSHIGEI